MKWFKRKIAKWVTEGSSYDEEGDRKESAIGTPPRMSNRKANVSSDDNDVEFRNPMNITLYNAQGGKIIKFTHRDRDTDDYKETTYIIPSDLDFEAELGKCITMEAMKHVS